MKPNKDQVMMAIDIEKLLVENQNFDSRKDPSKVRSPLMFSQQLYDRLPAGKRRSLGNQRATYDAVRKMIASNQPDDRLTGTAHTQLSLLETSLIAYGNAVAAYGVASSAADSKATSVASDNETKARKKVKRIEDLAKTELAERRKLAPDACPTSLLPSGCIEDIVTVYLGEGFERCFFHIITNYNSLPAPPSTMRKSVNILQAPYMVRDAVELLEDQGS